ncbi:MAG: hypothetical protein LBJ20_08265 [Candidatus Methanoplasma sp.]|jgi:hypothetical protein|nr:hypothetical protein [Candidatus Methanoplasma sp.]
MNMEKVKILSVLFAAAFLVAGISFVAAADDSDAATGLAGEFNVYYSPDGSAWTTYSAVSAYNAVQAIEATPIYVTGDVIDDAYTIVVGGYSDINPDYGTITTLNGTSNSGSNTWNVLVYANAVWDAATVAAGWYLPFDDYTVDGGAYATANVAVWYGDVADVETALDYIRDYATGDDAPIDLTVVDHTESGVFEQIFYIQDSTATPTITGTFTTYDTTNSTYSTGVTLTATDLSNGVYVVGYGHDSASALQNALGSNLVYDNNTNPIPAYVNETTAYGWIDTIFGLGTVSSGSTYTYWSLYTAYPPVGSNYANYGIGAYSELTNAPMFDDTLSLIYEST